MPELLFDPTFWLSVGQIILIDILLGGDNAVVIALACRKLPEEQRRKGIFWGVAGAIGLRVVLIFFALQLLALPLLKVVGALLLFWIGVKLLRPEDGKTPKEMPLCFDYKENSRARGLSEMAEVLAGDQTKFSCDCTQTFHVLQILEALAKGGAHKIS